MNESNRSITSAEWSALKARILSYSRELEPELARAASDLVGALSGLDELGTLTQKWMTPPTPKPESPPLNASSLPESAPSAPAPKIITPPSAHPTPAVSYRTSRKEYAPALSQQELVQALLHYQQRRGVKSSRNIIPGQSRQEKPPSEFSPIWAPEIQAEPKSRTLRSRRDPEIRIPVLRSNPNKGADHE